MLDKIIKYTNNTQENIKASYDQQKSTGQLFFSVSVNANDPIELKKISKQAIIVCTDVCNDFNKQLKDKEKVPRTPPKGKEKNKVRM